MDANKKRTSIDLPRDSEFKKDLKRQAIDEGYNSPKQMIEEKTIQSLNEWRGKE